MSGTLLQKSLKVTVVGDGCVGKTCLLVSYVRNEFPSEHVPTVFDMAESPQPIIYKDASYKLTLWDTAGQENYDKLRTMTYPNTDVIILCYSIASTASFENIHLKWVPELKKHIPQVPVVLVATQVDKRPEGKDVGSNLISAAAGKKLKQRINAAAFLECSALTRYNIGEVFGTAVQVTDPNFNKTLKCTIL